MAILMLLLPLITTFSPCWSSSKKSFSEAICSMTNLREAPLSIRSKSASMGEENAFADRKTSMKTRVLRINRIIKAYRIQGAIRHRI